MKKLIIFSIAAAAAFSSCQMAEMEGGVADPGDAFRLEVNIGNTETKTVLDPDGFKVSWAPDDALSVVAGKSDGSYKGYKFVKSASGANVFECTDFDPEDVTEYHVFYPYSENLTSIGEDGFANADITIGSSADAAQTGEADGVGSNAPLCGFAAVSDGSAPAITLGHISTLFAVSVMNITSSTIAVSEVSVANSSGSAMTGTYKVSSKGETEAVETAATAAVAPTGVTLASGASKTFYVVSAPFSLQQNDDITITVKTDLAGQTVKTIKKVMNADVDFKAGRYNTTDVYISDGSTFVNIKKTGETAWQKTVDFTASQMLDAYEETLDVTVQSNGKWTIDLPEGITASKSEGGQDNAGTTVEETVTLTIDNSDVKVTDGSDILASTVTFSTGSGEPATLNIKQHNSYSNCYVVHKPGTYTIPAGKPDGTLVADASAASWLFETEQGLISGTEPSYSAGKVTFTVKESTAEDRLKGGYGIVVLTNPANEIVWSYLIWYTKEIKDIQIGDYRWLDRNIGAWTDNLPASDFNSKLDQSSYGCYYQWGRKDPFPGPSNEKFKVRGSDESSEFGEYTLKGNFNSGKFMDDGYSASATGGAPQSATFFSKSEFSPMSAEHSTKYPWQFAHKDYISNDDKSLWSDTQKTVNDPCPVGYKVPSKDQMNGLFSDLEPLNKVEPFSFENGQGSWSRVYTIDGEEVFFPNNNMRVWSAISEGEDGQTGDLLYFWTSTPCEDEWKNADGSSRAYDGRDYSQSDQRVNRGLPVRCVKM